MKSPSCKTGKSKLTLYSLSHLGGRNEGVMGDSVEGTQFILYGVWAKTGVF